MLKHTILIGPPGTGKTRWARAQVSKCKIGNFDHHAYRLMYPDRGPELELSAPLRAPHHTVSRAGMFGRLDDHRWQPGEVSLAHGGILLLDDLPEFSRSIVEGLREPIETGRLTLANTRNVLHVPAQFTIVATANPCPCGWYGMTGRTCQCTAAMRERYLGRIPEWLRARCDVLWQEAYEQ